MLKRVVFLFIIFLLFAFGRQENLSCVVLADDLLPVRVSASDSLTFDFAAAIIYSLEHNDNIRAMRKGLSATERDIGIARSEMLPKLKFNEIFTVTNNPTEALSLKLNQTRAIPGDLTFGTLDYPGATTNFLTAGIIEQKIIDRKAMLDIKIAKKEYSANGYSYLRRQEELVNKVAHAYLKVKTNQELVRVAQMTLDDVLGHLHTAEKRYKAKKGPYSDILRAKTAVQGRGGSLNSAKRNLDVSKRNLGLLLGLDKSIEVTDTLPNIGLADISYYEQLAVYRNDVKATEIRVENAKNKIKEAQAAWYPTLNAVASYNLYNKNYPFGADGSNYIAGAFLRWDLFDGNKRVYEILKAKDKDAEAKEYLEELKKTVKFEVYEVFANIDEHSKNLELSLQAQKESEEDRKLIEKEWADSKLDIVALVDAQKNLDGAREAVIKNFYDLKGDLIDLGYVSGIICQELGLK